MFGYVKPKRSEMLVKDEAFYRAVYCGICQSMKTETGILSRALLTYDSVFLALCRMVFLPDTAFDRRDIFCPMHPLKKRNALVPNEAITYTVSAFSILSYYKMQDDKKDNEKKFATALLLPVSKSALGHTDMPSLEETVKSELAAIAALEAENSPSVDEGAEHFGQLLAEIFAYGTEGSTATLLRQTGFHLGKFIYAADAAEDYEKDKKEGKYNPFLLQYGKAPLTKENKESIKTGLLLEAEALSRALELYPFGKRHTLERILKNVVYLGLPERIRFLDEKKEEDHGSL